MTEQTAKTETPAVEKTHCANGHERATHWTTTKGGRSYCKACAREASQRSRAKNPRPASPRTLTPEIRDYLESLFKGSKKGSAELREQVEAFFDAHR